MKQYRFLIFLLFALVSFDIKGITHFDCKDENEITVMLDSIKPNREILYLLDSLVNNNAYVNNLNVNDKEDYNNSYFLIGVYGRTEGDSVFINMSDVNGLFSNFSLCGYFKYNGHAFFIEKGFPESLYKTTDVKMSVKVKDYDNTNKEICFIDEVPGMGVSMTYSKNSRKIVNVEDSSMPDILEVADQMPCYSSGWKNLKNDMDKLRAKYNGIYSGFAVVEFIIEKDGTTSNMTVPVNKSNCEDVVIKSMFESLGNWIPGRNKEGKCRIRYRLRFNF